MTTFEASENAIRQLDSREFESVEREVMQKRGGTVLVRPHRLEVSAGMALSPRLGNKAGQGQTLGLDYTWRTSERTIAPTFGVRLLTESFDTSLNHVERVSYQASVGLESPIFSLGPAALHVSGGLVGMWTEQEKKQLGADPEKRHFQRVGAVLQLSAEAAVTDAVGWSLNLAMIPTFFFESGRASAEAGDAHVAVSTVMFATVGVVLGL